MYRSLLSRSGVASVLLASMLLGPAAAVADAQQQATLTLEEAIRLARQNNPDYRSQSNDVTTADWGVRQAVGALLPSASVSGGMQYQADGPARFGVFTGEDLGLTVTPSYYISDYSIGMNYRFDAGSLSRLAEARANRRATEANVDAAAHDLAHAVTQQYLAVLRMDEEVRLNRRELVRAEENLKLVEARVEVGSAIQLDERQARVERGRAEVAVLRSENQRETEMLRLLEQIGVELDRSVELTSDFTVFQPVWSEDELLDRALAGHPRLNAYEAQVDAGDAAVSSARGRYLPSLDVSAGWSGYARQVGDAEYLVRQAEQQLENQRENCELTNQLSARLTEPLPGTPADCSVYDELPDEHRARILEQNDVFPFGVTGQPFSLRLGITLPIFQGFTRQYQVETARASREDARHAARGERLRLRTQVISLTRTLAANHRTVELEEQNRQVADEQLRLARERYEVGAADFMELTEAETIKARADRAYLDAVYGFHETLAALEAAVGAQLRTGIGDDDEGDG